MVRKSSVSRVYEAQLYYLDASNLNKGDLKFSVAAPPVITLQVKVICHQRGDHYLAEQVRLRNAPPVLGHRDYMSLASVIKETLLEQFGVRLTALSPSLFMEEPRYE